MRILLSILLLLSVKMAGAQPQYVSLVDTAVKEIESRDILYKFDSLYTEGDSNIRKRVSLLFIYSDFKRQMLIMVKEIKRQNRDSSVLQYFFRNRQLIKVCADIYAANITTTQQFYFNNGKLIFPDNYRSVFDVNDYVRKSKEYLLVKRKGK